MIGAGCETSFETHFLLAIHLNPIGEIAELTRLGESYTQIRTKANPDLIWFA